MKLNLVTNSQAPVGTLIEDLSKRADDVFMASAYISAKAVEALIARLNAGDSTLDNVDLLFGIDLETDANALKRLVEAASTLGSKLNARHTPHKAGRLFHPKLYFFRCGVSCHIIISSANLTHRGQFLNEEAYCHIECASSHPIVHQLAHIRQSWLSDAFSIPLDDSILKSKETYERAKRDYEDTIGRGGILPPDPIIDPVPVKSKQESIRHELAKGFLVSTYFSLAKLSIPVPVRDVVEQDEQTPLSGKAVVVTPNIAVAVKLLPDDAIKEFTKLHRQAQEACNDLAIAVPAGLYVPVSAQAALMRRIKELRRQHKILIEKYIKRRNPVKNHLKENLVKDCKAAWQRFHPEQDNSPESFIVSVKERVQQRRSQIDSDPAEAISFAVEASPHPLLLMDAVPNHPAWLLRDAVPEDEAFETLLSLLFGQLNAISDVTQRRQQPSLKRDLERARLLTAIRGKAINKLMVKLARLTRPESKEASAKSSSQQHRQKIDEEMAKVKSEADKHRTWLSDLRQMDREKALDLLFTEYNIA